MFCTPQPVLFMASVLALCVPPAAMDAFSSMATLSHLLSVEGRILDEIDSYISAEEQRLDALRGAVLSRRQEEESDDIYHPISAFHVIKKLLNVTGKVDNVQNERTLMNVLNEERAVYLTTTDLHGAADAILRLQRVYNLPTSQIAEGTVLGQQMGALDVDDFRLLGDLASRRGDYGLSAEWLEQAALALPMGPQKKDVLNDIAKVFWQMGDIEMAFISMQSASILDPNNVQIKAFAKVYKERLESMSEEERAAQPTTTTWTRNLPEWRQNYEKLCRGEADIEDTTRGGFCRYRPSLVAYSRIKEEILSQDPYIVMIYDVMTDAESVLIKEIAKPELNRAKVGDPANAQSTQERISKVAWLWDNKHGDVVRKLSRRVELLTGLSTTYRDTLSSSEPFQVVNYGLGGQYEPHVDFYEDRGLLYNVPDYLLGTGDRMSTFMFYLSDVTAGGATVFPRIRVRVPPVKNAAAFWFNLKRDGSMDTNTQHAGCPVLIGEKWVCNKWIREYGQEFLHQCGKTNTTRELDF